MDSYVYQLRLDGCPAPFYVGKGRGARMAAHFTATSLRERNRKNATIKAALAAGIEIRREILASDLTDEQATERVIAMIASLGRVDNGTGCLTNHTDGGDGPRGRIASAEQRRKASEAQKGRAVSVEARAKMSAAKKGRRPEAAIAASVAARLGRPLPEEWRESVSRGRKASEKAAAHRNDLAAWVAENGNPNVGRKHAAETRAKISASLKARR